MILFVDENIPLQWMFQHKNNPKHTSKQKKHDLKQIKSL